MENTNTTLKEEKHTESLSDQEDSVCKTPAENARLLKLFQIFIEIDQNLKKKNNANN